MRSKYLKKLVELVLSVVFYAILLPVFVIVRDVIGLDNQIVFNVIQLIVFLIVYGLVSILVEAVLKHLNDRARLLRKARGGRDVAAEEIHEDKSTGLISLSINDNK